MLAKATQEVSIPIIVTTTPSFVPTEVCQDLNVPSIDTGATFSKVVISTIEEFLAIIVLVSPLEVTIFMATLEPSKATPINP